MLDRTFFDAARRLLTRLLLALLAALAVAVIARQFVDGSSGDVSGKPTPTVTGPRIGRDHWHATYQVLVCGQRQPDFPFWPGGVHTHSDGVIHIHPVIPSEEYAGARLTKWFQYGGGRLTQDEIRMPGSRETLRNGDSCPDGGEGTLQVFVNGEQMEDWSQYIPQDGDRISIIFGPKVGSD